MATKKDKLEAMERLRSELTPGMEILCVLRHCSRSGMQRVIDLKYIDASGTLRGIGWSTADALGYRYDSKRDGIVVSGCGMDMGFHLVYNLAATLWRDGFDCVGKVECGPVKGCPSNDHSNRENNSHHRDGGYALRSRWV